MGDILGRPESSTWQIIMGDRIEISGLEVDRGLYELIDREIAPGTGVDSAHFWQSMAGIIEALGDSNKALLEKRDRLQIQLGPV